MAVHVLTCSYVWECMRKICTPFALATLKLAKSDTFKGCIFFTICFGQFYIRWLKMTSSKRMQIQITHAVHATHSTPIVHFFIYLCRYAFAYASTHIGKLNFKFCECCVNLSKLMEYFAFRNDIEYDFDVEYIGYFVGNKMIFIHWLHFIIFG